MVDFKNLLTPEQRAHLERARRTLAQVRECDTRGLVAEAIHTWHNTYSRVLVSESTYDAHLLKVLVPELLREAHTDRLARYVRLPNNEYTLTSRADLPTTCPICGCHVDWDRAETSKDLDEEEVAFLKKCAWEWTKIELAREWDASRRLVGRGLMIRDAESVLRVISSAVGNDYLREKGMLP